MFPSYGCTLKYILIHFRYSTFSILSLSVLCEQVVLYMEVLLTLVTQLSYHAIHLQH